MANCQCLQCRAVYMLVTALMTTEDDEGTIDDTEESGGTVDNADIDANSTYWSECCCVIGSSSYIVLNQRFIGYSYK